MIGVGAKGNGSSEKTEEICAMGMIFLVKMKGRQSIIVQGKERIWNFKSFETKDPYELIANTTLAMELLFNRLRVQPEEQEGNYEDGTVRYKFHSEEEVREVILALKEISKY